MNNPQTHYRTCNLCEAMCGLEIRHRNGEIESIRGDKQDAFSRGHICPKALALKSVHEDPNRLRQPLQKTADGHRPIGWEQALETVSARIASIQREHGQDAVAIYAGNPNVHHADALLYLNSLNRILRTKNRYSASTVDQMPHHVAGYEMYGHQLLVPVPDIDHTQLLVIMGANPIASNGSLMTAPDVRRRLKAIQQRGGSVIVIDPRKTETAALADEHLPIRPGTDVFLLLAVLHVMCRDELLDDGPWRSYSRGLDDLVQAVAPFPPERAEPLTGIQAKTIDRLAERMANTAKAAWYGRMGVSTQAFGTTCQWLIQAINIVSGHLDRVGGTLFTKPAIDPIGSKLKLASRGHHNRWQSRVRKLPEFAGELPVATLADEIDTPGKGQVRALITCAGNPVVSTPDGGRLERTLDKLDFQVAIDIYMNETSRHADIILPPTSALERLQYDLVFHLFAIRNSAKYADPLFTAPSDARHDWEIYAELATRLARKKRVGWRKLWSTRFNQWLGPERMLALALRTGPYGKGWRPWGRGLTLVRLKRHPHGLDLGPLAPSLPQRLPGGRIQLAPPRLLNDLARVEKVAQQERVEFSLIGRRHLRTNNSWLRHVDHLQGRKSLCTAMIAEEDARRMGITNGSKVRITSKSASIQAVAEVSDCMLPGVVSVPHGFSDRSHEHTGSRFEDTVSVNDLTDASVVDPMSGNAILNGVPVHVSPATEPSPKAERSGSSP